jgi:hypothetical protein
VLTALARRYRWKAIIEGFFADAATWPPSGGCCPGVTTPARLVIRARARISPV